jgi:hypothetical protein
MTGDTLLSILEPYCGTPGPVMNRYITSTPGAVPERGMTSPMVPFLDSADAYPAVKRIRRRQRSTISCLEKLKVNKTPSCSFLRQAFFNYPKKFSQTDEP